MAEIPYSRKITATNMWKIFLELRTDVWYKAPSGTNPSQCTTEVAFAVLFQYHMGGTKLDAFKYAVDVLNASAKKR